MHTKYIQWLSFYSAGTYMIKQRRHCYSINRSLSDVSLDKSQCPDIPKLIPKGKNSRLVNIGLYTVLKLLSMCQ